MAETDSPTGLLQEEAKDVVKPPDAQEDTAPGQTDCTRTWYTVDDVRPEMENWLPGTGTDAPHAVADAAFHCKKYCVAPDTAPQDI